MTVLLRLSIEAHGQGCKSCTVTTQPQRVLMRFYMASFELMYRLETPVADVLTGSASRAPGER
jgi:hypothetical protein